MQNTNRLKIIAVIQARIGSARLSKKVLRKINGKTLIEWINYRLSFCKEVNKIVLSTSVDSANDVLADLATEINLDYYRGSETDLVQRLNDTANKFHADAIVRITGDCPLVDPELVDKIVSIYRGKADSLDYITNILPPTFPDGLDIEIISTPTLKRLDREVKDPLYREWITTTIMENLGSYKIFNYSNDKNISYLRLTVDYQEDLDLVSKIFDELHVEGKIFVLEDILALLKRKPELVEINKKWVDKTIINNIRSNEFHNLKNINNFSLI